MPPLPTSMDAPSQVGCEKLSLKSCFLGTFDEARLKQGQGVYVWVSEPNEDGDRTEIARYEGSYVDGVKSGIGKLVFPNGDLYEGEFRDNLMHGVGSYTYKASQDIYSGEWSNGKKHGQGRYEFFADKSMLSGSWEKGFMVAGDWELKDFAVFSGTFRQGVPVGPGRFTFKSGLVLPGSFEETLPDKGPEESQEREPEEDGEGEAAPAEDIPAEPPIVHWRGESIVSF